MSIISYYVIENLFEIKILLAQKYLIISILSSLIILISIMIAIIFYNGFYERFGDHNKIISLYDQVEFRALNHPDGVKGRHLQK